MALVLVGASSYSLVYTDDSGRTQRVNVKRGQDVSGLNLPSDRVDELKALTVRGAARRTVPLFVEMGVAPGPEGRHMQGGKVSNANLKAQSDVIEEAAKAAEPVKDEESVKAEKPTEPKKAPAKKKATSKKTDK